MTRTDIPEKILALFDFDGTLTRRDSLPAFTIFAVGLPRFALGILRIAPDLIRFLLNKIPNHSLKESWMTEFFGGWESDAFQRTAGAFSISKIPELLRPGALDRINWHLQQQHTVILVSASVEQWLKPWCDTLGIRVLATGLETRDGRITGRLSPPNCYGPEKVRRIEQVVNPAEFHRIYAYGDSSGDTEMLELATDPVFKPFR